VNDPRPGNIGFGEIFLEVTNVCNLNCTFCVNDVMTRDRGFMKEDLFKRLIDEISADPGVEKVLFHVMGEPTLHPKIIELVNYAAKRVPRQILITNATTLTSDDSIIKIFNTGLTNLDLSFYSNTDDEFKKRGARNLTYGEYLKIIKRILFLKYQGGFETNVRLYVFNKKHDDREKVFSSRSSAVNSDHILRQATYWSDYLEEISRCIGVPIEIATLPTSLADEKIKHGAVLKLSSQVELTVKPLESWLGSQDSGRSKAILGKCGLLSAHAQLGILWNGDVVLCCGDYEGGTAVGNVSERSIADVLKGKRMKYAERMFSLGVIPFDTCRVCLGGGSKREMVRKGFGTCLVNTRGIGPAIIKVVGDRR